MVIEYDIIEIDNESSYPNPKTGYPDEFDSDDLFVNGFKFLYFCNNVGDSDSRLVGNEIKIVIDQRNSNVRQYLENSFYHIGQCISDNNKKKKIENNMFC